MEVEKESITRNNIEQHVGLIWSYEKEEEEEQQGDMDKLLAYNNIISDSHHHYQENFIGTYLNFWLLNMPNSVQKTNNFRASFFALFLLF